MFQVKCACGHLGDIDTFTSTPMSGPLPNGHYQCPACSRAWKVERQGRATVYPDGFMVPAKRACVPVNPKL